MIGVKQHNETWRIVIKDEILEFKDREAMGEILSTLLDIKEDFGSLKERD